ncbi:MAG: YicC family protein [Clostridia bacterium]|nr:YicC family protein [Clostridia bacterium]
MKSMTGYGTAETLYAGKKITVEIKSVNSRYSDISVKMPRLYSFLEAPVKKAVTNYTSRGKIDVYINIDSSEDDTKAVSVNVSLAKAYQDAINRIAEATETQGEVNAITLARLPDVLSIDAEDEDSEEMTRVVLTALDEAGRIYTKMREDEGYNMLLVLTEHLNVIENIVNIIEEHAPEIVVNYRAKIEARMKEIMGNVPYDESRLLTEVALFADKVNVDEEIARLKSHIDQMKEMFKATEPIGRKMDFLIQEMNREINTTGSKCNNLSIARNVIDVKAEIEKLREQVQNIE